MDMLFKKSRCATPSSNSREVIVTGRKVGYMSVLSDKNEFKLWHMSAKRLLSMSSNDLVSNYQSSVEIVSFFFLCHASKW